MKTRELTTCPLLRRLPAAAAALVLSMGAAQTASAQATNYPATILNDNPTVYYRFEETSGATAYDSTSNQWNASYDFNSAGSPELGEPGIDTNSILFTGGGPGGNSDYGYVSIPATPLITPVASNGTSSAPFSAELWLEPTEQASTYEVPIEVAKYPNGWNIYITGADSGANSRFVLNMPNGVFFSSFGSNVQFLSWYHLVLTYDGTNETLYINGASTGTYPAALVPAVGTEADIGSGQNVYTGFAPFLGGVDEVAFYTNVLTAGQVSNHYAVGTNSFRAGFLPAGILAGPSNETNYSGLPVTFSVTPSGTPPFTYIWLSNSVPVGPDADALTFTAEYPGNNGANIAVVVSNSYGPPFTSSVVTLTVLTNVNIVAPPGSILRNVGSFAAFHVTANGPVPITYQWSVSTDSGNTFSNISSAANPTATNQTLWLSNVQLSQDNNMYSVLVGNPFASASAAATLNVQARQDPPVPLTGYGAIVAADNPVAYWRLDETSNNWSDGAVAEDAVGSFDGSYNVNNGSFVYGAPTGIPHSTDPAVTFVGTPGGSVSTTSGGGTIQVPFAPELNSDTAWSVETWIQPSSLGINGNDYRVILSSQYNRYPFAYNGWYLYQQAIANNFAFVPEPGNAFITAGTDNPASANQIVPGTWYYLVIADDTTNFYLYVNGMLGSSYPVSGDPFIPNGDGINSDGSAALTSIDPADGGASFFIGQRTDAQFGTFLGTVDDTAVYNYALSPQQIASHYANGARLNIAKSGANVTLTWPVGVLQASTNVSGVFTNVPGATSPYTNAASATAQFYRLQVP